MMNRASKFDYEIYLDDSTVLLRVKSVVDLSSLQKALKRKNVKGNISALISKDDDCLYVFEEDGKILDLPPGKYIVELEENPNDLTEVNNLEVCLSYQSLNALIGKKFNELRERALQGKHNITQVAFSRDESQINYSIGITSTHVVIALDCTKVYDKILSYSKHQMTPYNGEVHFEAAKIAQYVPFNTLLHFCTSESDQGKNEGSPDAESSETSQPKRRTKNLLFCGFLLSGNVAHLAALRARSMVRNSNLNMEVKAVTFATPFFTSNSFVSSISEKDASYHLNVCSTIDTRLYHLINALKLSSCNMKDELFKEYFGAISNITKSSNMNDQDINILKKMSNVVKDAISSCNNCDLVPFGIHAFISDNTQPIQYTKHNDVISIISEIKSNGTYGPIPWHCHFENNVEWINGGILSHIHMKPTISECRVISTSEKIELIVLGTHLESIFGREFQLHHPNIESLDWSEGFIFKSLNDDNDDNNNNNLPKSLHKNTNMIIVSRSSFVEARFILLNSTLLPSPKLAVQTDFGKSEKYSIPPSAVIDGKEQTLSEVMYSGVNINILETCFIRGMLHKYLKIDSPLLDLLKGLEEVTIKTSDISKLITEYSSKDSNALMFSRQRLRKILKNVIKKIVKQFKLYTSGIPKLIRTIASTVGTIVGGVITFVGAVASIPGLLIMLPSFLISNELNMGMAPGAIVAAPGLLLAALGFSIIQVSAEEMEEVQNYLQSLKFLLLLLGGDPSHVLEEVTCLENEIYNKFYRVSFDQDHPVQLHDADEKQVRFILEDIEKKNKDIAKHPSKLFAVAKNQEEVVMRYRIVGKLRQIRRYLENNIVLSFVGIHNAGKSTFIEKLFGIKTNASALKRTEEVKLYRVNNEDNTIEKNLTLDVADFPGSSDEREIVAQLTEHIGCISTFFFCVFTAGHIAKPERDVMNIIKQHKKPYLIIINKVETLHEFTEKESEFRTDYAERLGVQPELIFFSSALIPEKLESVRLLLFHTFRHWISEELCPQLSLLLLHPDTIKMVREVANEKGPLSKMSLDVMELMLENQSVTEKLLKENINYRQTAVDIIPQSLPKNGDPLYSGFLDILLAQGYSPSLISVILNGTWKNINKYLGDPTTEKPSEDLAAASNVLTILEKLLEAFQIIVKSIQDNYDIKEKVILPSIFTLCSYPSILNISGEKLYEKCLDLCLISLSKKKEEEETKIDTKTVDEEDINDIIQGTEAMIILKTASKFNPILTNPINLQENYTNIIKPTADFKERLVVFNNELEKQSKKEMIYKWNIPSDYNSNDILLSLGSIPPSSMKSIFIVEISEDEAIDLGGVLKSLLTTIGNSFRNNECYILKAYDSGQVYFDPSVTERNSYLDKEEIDMTLKKMMRGFGRLIGFSIVRNSATIGAPLSPVLFKLIFCCSLEFSDLETFSPDICRSIKNMALMPGNIVSTLGLNFTVTVEQTSSDGSNTKKYLGHNLIQNGSKKPVTARNRSRYLELLIQYYLGKHLPLMEFILGIQDVCPRDLLSIFTPPMLHLLVCGESHIDVEDIIKNMSVSDSLKKSPEQIEWLHKSLRSMSSADLTLFLTFVTGSSILPSGGASLLSPGLSVRKNNKGNDHLPISHTCFNILEIPLYPSYEILNDKLLLAIRGTSSLQFGMV